MKLKFKNIFKWVRITSVLIWFLLLPLFFINNLFWGDAAKIPLTREWEDSRVWFKPDIESISRPGHEYAIRKILKTPFDLDHYEVCIKNETYAIENEKTEFLPVTVTFEEDIIEPFEILAKGEECKVFRVDEFSYTTNIRYYLKFFPTTFSIEGSVLPGEYANQFIWDKIALSFIFLVLWFQLSWLGTRIYGLFRNEINLFVKKNDN